MDVKTLNTKKVKSPIKYPTEAKALIIRYLLDMVNYLILFLLLNNVFVEIMKDTYSCQT